MRYVHTCYRVLDLDRSIDFYTNKLGLELARKSPSATMRPTPSSPSPATPSPGWSSPSTTTRKSLTSRYGYSHVAFAVEDLDALAKGSKRPAA